MKKTISLWMGIVVILLLIATPVWSHGTSGSTEQGEGIMVKAEYDDGEPMSYAAVEVKVQGIDIPFQTGRTDKNGIFMFAPDQAGTWQIAVSDEMGHRLALDRRVETADRQTSSSDASKQAVKSGLSRRDGMITGIAVIFGLCGVVYGWQAGRRRAAVK
jgi:nickel transport protein